jgi:DNA mismatch endonuclease (patch repair protein)
MSKWPGNAKQVLTTFGGLSRSGLMSRIRNTGNMTTEIRMVNLLKKACLKGWRRHAKLLGKPDFVWPAAKVAVFVDGCFWHGHNCARNLTPGRNVAAWQEKFTRNRQRDKKVTRELKKREWKVVRIWECSLTKRPKVSIKRIEKALAKE